MHKRFDLPHLADAAAAIERTALSLDLVVQPSTLAKYPGCTHWHFRKKGEKGTLEATYWPKTDEAWLEIRGNRAGTWVEQGAQEFLGRIARNEH